MQDRLLISYNIKFCFFGKFWYYNGLKSLFNKHSKSKFSWKEFEKMWVESTLSESTPILVCFLFLYPPKPLSMLRICAMTSLIWRVRTFSKKSTLNLVSQRDSNFFLKKWHHLIIMISKCELNHCWYRKLLYLLDVVIQFQYQLIHACILLM